ncbi:hypothetical protein ABZY19_37495 [Streptomyces sp. NPDC006475]|uniref:hypothetical protein n=1 Tax=Streptomyces sp. NPDC006475 TaxID=3155719 RepID=UPI0033B71AF2
MTDNYADGLRTILRWELGDRTKSGTSGYIVRTGECHNAKGAGQTVWCNYDFPEGQYNGTSRYLVHFKIESQDGPNGTPVYWASAPPRLRLGSLTGDAEVGPAGCLRRAQRHW